MEDPLPNVVKHCMCAQKVLLCLSCTSQYALSYAPHAPLICLSCACHVLGTFVICPPFSPGAICMSSAAAWALMSTCLACHAPYTCLACHALYTCQASPPLESATACTDTPSQYMLDNGVTCDSWYWMYSNRCNSPAEVSSHL